MNEYLEFAKKLVVKGGKLIVDNFEKNHNVETKADSSPVTEIDKQINQLIMDSIKQSYPDHGLLGEEGDQGTGEENLQWICDPLDDTKGFIKATTNSMCMLGLSSAGKMLLSTVYDPFGDKLYWAVKGGGAFCNGSTIHVNQETLKGGKVLLGEKSAEVFIESIKKTGGVAEMISGTGFKCMMLASGDGCGILKIETDYHDIGPGSLIIEEAGGLVTSLDGSSLLYNQKINGAVFSNGAAHEELLKVAKTAVNNEA